MRAKVFKWLGIEPDPTRHREKIISASGAFIGILAVYAISSIFAGGMDGALIVASMGATSVLLFIVPHGPLSQPWSIVGGHLVSAFAGVLCARYVPDKMLAAALSVGIASYLMCALRCVHPPGGATALTAVIAGPDIHALGFGFMFTPVLLNVLVLLVVAFAFNALFPWRRYPSAWHASRQSPLPSRQEGSPPADIMESLREVGVLSDASEQDLARIYDKINKS